MIKAKKIDKTLNKLKTLEGHSVIKIKPIPGTFYENISVYEIYFDNNTKLIATDGEYGENAFELIAAKIIH